MGSFKNSSFVIGALVGDGVGCGFLRNQEECKREMYQNKFCDKDIKSSIEEMKQCRQEIRDMECEESLPNICKELE